MISARQLLTWLDGRNGSSFQNLAFDGSQLTFTMAMGAGSDGLEAMLPLEGGTGSLMELTHGGAPVPFTEREVKGVTYAVFAPVAGPYAATYGSDTTPPVVTNVVATPKSTSSTISWTTDEPSSSEVHFGTTAGALSLTATSPGLVTSHSVTLTGLTPSTTHHYRVSSADTLGNATTSPSSPAPPSQFTTRQPEVEDTTVADFSAGSGTGTSVVQTGDGALVLGQAEVYDFGSGPLPATLTEGPAWTAGSSATVTGGALHVDGTRVRTSATYGIGSSVEFVATFGSAPFQHLGFGTDFDVQPWAFFSTNNTNTTLYARTKTTSGTTDTPLVPVGGPLLGVPHRYRIEWGASDVRFFIDGQLVQTHAAAISTPMQAAASDFNTGAPSLSVDSWSVVNRGTSGTFTSRVLDAGGNAAWSKLFTEGSLPAGTTWSFETRSGNTASPDGSWSAWTPVGPSNQIASPYGRYVQYRVALGTSNVLVSPEVRSVALSYTRTGTVTGYVAMLPPSDSHKFTVLIDGVPFGTPAGNNENSGPITLPAGQHRMSLAPAGDTNMASYTPFFLGDCAIDGTLTVTAGGTVGCLGLTYPRANPGADRDDLGSTDRSAGVRHRPGSVHDHANRFEFFPVSVNYATQDGTAKVSAGDYVATSGTLTFAASDPPTKTVSVPISATGRHTVSDTFNLALSGVSGASLSDATGTATLINRNGPISVYVSDPNVIRSTSGNSTAAFTLSLSAPPATGEQVTVQVSTANGTAKAGTDYTKVSPTTVTFGPGQQTAVVNVAVAPQPLATATRAFKLAVKTPSANAVLADTSGTATLRSSGVAAPAPAIYVSDTTLLRPATGTDSAVFTISLSAPSASPVTVKYATQDGTALAPGDYTAKTPATKLTFAPGEVTKTVAVTVAASGRHVLGQDFSLKLTAPTAASIEDNIGTARLINRSGLIAISGDDAVHVRSAGIGTTATITLRLSAAPAVGETVTFNVATANGTAIAGTDYSGARDDAGHVHRGTTHQDDHRAGPARSQRHPGSSIQPGVDRAERERVHR